VSAACVVTAKAPVAGLVKTRLARRVGPERAAELAAAALLDTLVRCSEVFAPGQRFLALAGEATVLDRDARLATALRGWVVFPQEGAGLGGRIVHAHRHVHAHGHNPVVQVGMDTPQLSAHLLRTVVHLADRGNPVVGPALDGGWWVLATSAPAQADPVGAVPMSTPHTLARTLAALDAAGHRPELAPTLRDVDEVEDAQAVAADAPTTHFARAWAS
jgi:glycosyltransferase A (GT-A) superfamily protein (DUF2064 family)